MSGGTSKLIAVLAAALLAAWILAACGSENDSTATSASTVSQTNAGGRADDVEIGPLKVVGGGSASYKIPGHYANVPIFGEETTDAELEVAAEVEHGYLAARVEKDWPKACSYVSQGLLQRLASHPNLAGKDCPAMLATITKPGPGGSDYESSEVEAQSLRIRGLWAYFLYRAASAPYFMPMVREEGIWKVNLIAPVAFYS